MTTITHVHHEIVAWKGGKLLGTCPCGRVKDYTALQIALGILSPESLTRTGVNLSQLMKTTHGKQKKRYKTKRMVNS